MRVTDARGIFADANLILTVSTPDAYVDWINTIEWMGRDSAPGGDPDVDGFTNFMKYALGGNPLASEPSIQPAVGMEDGILTLCF